MAKVERRSEKPARFSPHPAMYSIKYASRWIRMDGLSYKQRLGQAENSAGMLGVCVAAVQELLGTPRVAGVMDDGSARAGDESLLKSGVLNAVGSPAEITGATFRARISVNDTSVGSILVSKPSLTPSEKAAVRLHADLLGSELELQAILLGFRRMDEGSLQDLELISVLDVVLGKVVDEIGLEFAGISLVDFDANSISMVRGRNIAPGWIQQTSHSLASGDVQARVATSGRTIRNDGSCESFFHRPTWERYIHKDLARVWCPIVANRAGAPTVVGTIEAGCYRPRGDQLLTPENVRRIEQLGLEFGDRIARLPLRALRLKRLTRETMIATGATGVALILLPAGESRPPVLAAENLPAADSMAKSLAETESEIGADSFCPLHGHPGAFARRIDLRESRCYLVVKFAGHALTPGRTRLLEAFFTRMAIAVRGGDVRDHLADLRDRAERAASLYEAIGNASRGAGALEPALEEIAQRALAAFDADTVALYAHSESSDPQWRALIRHYGHLHRPELMPESFPRRIAQGMNDEMFESWAQEVPLLVHSWPSDRAPRFIVREGVQSCAILRLRAEGTDVVGLLFVNYRQRKTFADREKHEIRSLANSLAVLIKADRFRLLANRALERREKELSALHRLDDVLLRDLTSIDVDKFCRRMLAEIVQIIDAPVACVLFESQPGQLRIPAGIGFTIPKAPIPRDRGVIGRVLRQGKPENIRDTSKDPEYFALTPPPMKSELVVPLREHGRVAGAINLEHPDRDRFQNEDLRLLELLAARFVFAIHIVRLYGQLNEQMQPRQILSRIAIRIQEPGRSLDSVLRLIFTGITCAQGLRFSRAMLFLREDPGDRLRGRFAVGPATRAEADADWDDINRRSKDVSGTSALEWSLDEADRGTQDIEGGLRPLCELHRKLTELEVPGSTDANALMSCIQDKRPMRVERDQPDWLRSALIGAGLAPNTPYPYHCVPLLAGVAPIGIFVVDNLYRDDPDIDTPNPEALWTIEAFAELAALSIENRRLRDRGRIDLYRAVAHQTLTPINRAFRLLEDGTARNQPADPKVLLALLARAVRAASGSRLFAGLIEAKTPDVNLRPAKVRDLASILRGLVAEFSMTERALTFQFEEPEFIESGEAPVSMDSERIEHVFSNILENAAVYAFRGSGVTVSGGLSDSRFCVRIANRGQPLSPAVLRNATVKYWRGEDSRQVHASGHGLGLWIVERFLTAHGGSFGLTHAGGSTVASVVLRIG